MTTKLTIPSADLDRDLEINMSEITYAEGRFDEIAIVNTHKAPELMSCFVKAYSWCVEHVTNISAEAVKAETAANFRKAEIILEEMPGILKEKGIAGKSNEDYRNAIIAMDKKHIALMERLNHIEMYREMFKGKLNSLDRAYMAVRKIFGSSMDFKNPNLGSNHGPMGSNGGPFQYSTDARGGLVPINPQIKVDITYDKPPSNETTSVRNGFGKPKD